MELNSVFQFGGISVEQNAGVHKVGTDSLLLCRLARWPDATNILDIGTGTGICALYLASIHPKVKDFVGVDSFEAAAQLAGTNFERNALPCTCSALHLDLKSFAESTTQKFDLIVCNPPFFHEPSKSPKEHRQLARHTDALPPYQLFKSSKSLLSELGTLWVVIPYTQRENYIQTACLSGLYFNQEILVKTHPERPIERCVICYSHQARPYERKELLLQSIIDAHGF